jgi:hypothetical protein
MNIEYYRLAEDEIDRFRVRQLFSAKRLSKHHFYSIVYPSLEVDSDDSDDSDGKTDQNQSDNEELLIQKEQYEREEVVVEEEEEEAKKGVGKEHDIPPEESNIKRQKEIVKGGSSQCKRLIIKMKTGNHISLKTYF